MDRAISDGWRYLSLDPSSVLSLTPRKFRLLMEAQVERRYDDFERQAVIAMMHERAHRMKQPKTSDLFTRPFGEGNKREVEAQIEQAEHANTWLSQFDFSGEEDNK